MDAERAARIAALKAHPAWTEMVAEVDATVEKYAAALAKKMLSDGEPYDNFEYKRGFLAGLQAFARYPETATAIVKRDMAQDAGGSE